MKRHMLISSFAVLVLASPMLTGGCEREIEHSKTTTIKRDGTVKEKERTVTESPDGTIKEKETKKVTEPD